MVRFIGNYGDISIKAGFSEFDNGPTAGGGNIVLGATSNINGYSGVALIAERGTDAGANGNITQYGGQIVASVDGGEGGQVSIYAGGNIDLGGSVTAFSDGGWNTGIVLLKAGFSEFDSGPTAGGGNIVLRESSVITGQYKVLLAAERGADVGANGNITQYGGQIVAGVDGGEGGSVSIHAGGNIDLGGSVGAWVASAGFYSGDFGEISIAAGRSFSNNAPTAQGGNIVLGASSDISGQSDVSLVAERGTASPYANGNITQETDGQITAGANGGYGMARIVAGGSIDLGGSVMAYSNGNPGGYHGVVRLNAGYSYNDALPTAQGGNIILRSGSNISGEYGVSISAERGTVSPYANGNITQYGGQIIAGVDGGEGGNVNTYAGGNIELGGSVRAWSDASGNYGDVLIKAGFTRYDNSPTTEGGNIVLQSGSVISGQSDVDIFALAGSVSAGSITQYGSGQIIAGASGGYGDVLIRAGGSIDIGGSITAYGKAGYSGWGGSIEIVAGGYYGYPTDMGGNIVLRGSSVLTGQFEVTLTASRGTVSGINGNITQDGSGQIIAGVDGGEGGYVSVYADGHAELGGSVIAHRNYVDDDGGEIYIRAGYGGAPANASIATISGYSVDIRATGSIIDLNGVGITNITSQFINLESTNGGTISADTASEGEIYANVGSGSTTGGIRIANTSAVAPGYVSLVDEASANSAVSFTQNFTAGGTLAISSLNLSVTPYGSIALASNDGLVVDAAFGSSMTNMALKGAAVDINEMLLGYGVAVNGNSVTIGSSGSISSSVDLGVIASNLQLNGGLDAGRYLVIAGGHSGSVDASGVLSYTKTGGTNLTAYGGAIYAQEAMKLTLNNGLFDGTQVATYYGDIDVSAQQNLVLNNGASFSAGNDIWLTLLGGDSKLVLNESAGMAPSTMTADTYTNDGRTIHIDFPSRQSGGIIIDGAETSVTQEGGSGFYWGDPPVVATAGNGLAVTFGANTTVAVILEALDKAKDAGQITEEDYFVLEQYVQDNAQLFEQTTGGDEGEFGEGEKKGKKKAGMCRG